MTMHNGGLSKLVEESGELLQIIGKLQAYPDGIHPDGEGNLWHRLQDELADTQAAIKFVLEKNANKIDGIRFESRVSGKLRVYREWDKEECRGVS